MTRSTSAFRQYLNSSRSIHYGLILTLPALAVYEIGIFLLFNDSVYELRNSGEVLLRQLFDTIGLTNIYVVSGILAAVFMVVMIRGYRIERAPGLKANHFFYMLLESLFWGAVLYLIMEGFARMPFQLLQLQEKIANINLAIGAGIFEELIFRMILISALLVILEYGLGQKGRWTESLAILLAAVVFAAFHLFLEAFLFPIFMQRVLGGIFLGFVYRYRGYGISVYSHIVFNLLILAGTW